MPNPRVPQGTLNRLRGSVIFPGNANLNVTAAFLGKAAIAMAFEGDSGQLLATLTGAVSSPEPYMIATVRMNLLKSQNLANIYKQQVETDINVGDISIRGDANTLDDYELSNCIIMHPRDIDFSGNGPDWNVSIMGVYYINNDLWNAS